VTRRIAAAVLLVLCVCAAPPDARAPRPVAAGWDLFAADAVLAALPGPAAAAALDPAEALPSRRAAAAQATPEPGPLVLVALGLVALGRSQRRRSASH